MIYKDIKYVNKPVSNIFFGTATPTFLAGEEQNELLDAVLEMGVNAIDTARVYQGSESVIGKWLSSRGCRDKVVLLSKCAHPSPLGVKRVSEKAIRSDFETSSRNLQTDYIDIYLLHRDNPKVPVGDIVEWLNAMHAEGKIGAFGGSNWTHERIQEANEYAYAHNLQPFTASSPYFGLADQICDPWGGGCISVAGPSNASARDWYRKADMPIIAYSSLGNGLFSGRMKSNDTANVSKYLNKYAIKGYGCPENYERLRRCEEVAAKKGYTVPQIAMAWIYNQDLNVFAIVGTTNADRMRQNIEALDIKLSEAEIKYLDLQ